MTDAMTKWGEKPTRAELHALPPVVLVTLEAIAPCLGEMLDRIEALESQLAAKGIGAPGTVTIDPAVVQFVRDYCWRTEEKVDTIERECMRYRGVYDPDTLYPKGSVVTRNGSWWLAEYGVQPGEMPGHDNTNWKLCVKGDRREKPK